MSDFNLIIENDIPIPTRTNLPVLPLGEMKEGQSFVLHIGSDSNDRTIQALRQRICRYQVKFPSKKFSVRKDPKGMRVFRIQ